MNYSVSEFRKNIRTALDIAEAGGTVTIQRHDKTFILLTMLNYNEAIVSAAKDGVSRLVTYEESANIRPDIVTSEAIPANVVMLSTPKGENIVIRNIASDSQANEQPCCEKRTPCKHWVWSEDQQVYTNTLSNRERQPE